jgi:hypothetical protein
MTAATVGEVKRYIHLDEMLELSGVIATDGAPLVELRLSKRRPEAVAATAFKEIGVLRIPAYLLARSVPDIPVVTTTAVESALYLRDHPEPAA